MGAFLKSHVDGEALHNFFWDIHSNIETAHDSKLVMSTSIYWRGNVYFPWNVFCFGNKNSCLQNLPLPGQKPHPFSPTWSDSPPRIPLWSETTPPPNSHLARPTPLPPASHRNFWVLNSPPRQASKFHGNYCFR